MPILKCSDCGGIVSDLAEACPHCGCPVSHTLSEKYLDEHPVWCGWCGKKVRGCLPSSVVIWFKTKEELDRAELKIKNALNIKYSADKLNTGEITRPYVWRFKIEMCKNCGDLDLQKQFKEKYLS